jgi:hypothetical protein
MYLQAHYPAIFARKSMTRLMHLFGVSAIICAEETKADYEKFAAHVQRTHACEIHVYTHRDFLDDTPVSDYDENGKRFELMIVDVDPSVLDIVPSGYLKTSVRHQIDAFCEQRNILLVLM